jgi:hypothetical protein
VSMASVGCMTLSISRLKNRRAHFTLARHTLGVALALQCPDTKCARSAPSRWIE